MVERRKYERFATDDTGIIRVKGGARKVFVEDISECGARLKLSQELKITELSRLRLFIYDRDAQGLISLDCVVRRIFHDNGLPVLGVQFTEGNAVLRKMIMLIKEDLNRSGENVG